MVHRPGNEPGPPSWQATILPVNHRCNFFTASDVAPQMKEQKVVAIHRIPEQPPPPPPSFTAADMDKIRKLVLANPEPVPHVQADSGR